MVYFSMEETSSLNTRNLNLQQPKNSFLFQSRWQRSRSRERCPAGTIFTLAPGPDSSGTEYAGDGSSEHSTPANSPRHRIKRSEFQYIVVITVNPSDAVSACMSTRSGIGLKGVSLSTKRLLSFENFRRIPNHRHSKQIPLSIRP